MGRRRSLFALGVDLLAGFPGERDFDFRETLNFAARLPLTYAHVFPFSPRPGTVAAHMGGQVPEPIRRHRAKLLRTLAETKRRQFWETLALHREVMMVVERMRPHRVYAQEDREQPSQDRTVDHLAGATHATGPYIIQGKCEYYVPCRVNTFSNDVHVRQLLRIRPIAVNSRGLECTRPEESPTQGEL